MMNALKVLAGGAKVSSPDVVVDREAIQAPVVRAKAKLEGKAAEYANIAAEIGSFDAELSELQHAFDADRTEAQAKKIVKLRETLAHKSIYLEAAERSVSQAQRELHQAEAIAKEKLIAALSQIAGSTHTRLMQLWDTRSKLALDELAAVLYTADEIVSEDFEVVKELSKLQVPKPGMMSASSSGSYAKLTAWRSIIPNTTRPAFDKVAELFR